MVTDAVEWKASIQYAIPGWVAIFQPRRTIALVLSLHPVIKFKYSV